MSEITITEVSKTFASGAKADQSRVLDGVSLTVGDGEFVGLLGPSGCGKTTLLRCVAGLEFPDSGSIGIGDHLVVDIAARRIASPESRGIGMVFQSYALWPHLTVAENIAYPLRRRRVARSLRPKKIDDALELVGLAGYGRRRPHELSGGQQQRVAIARAIVSEPRVMLFDEPLSNLDANLRRLLRREIRALHERIGTTTLYVTHDQDEIGALADRVAVLSAGSIVQVGTPTDVFSSPASRRVAEFVGFDNYLPGQVSADDPSVFLLGERRIRVSPGHSAQTDAGATLAIRSRALSLDHEAVTKGNEQIGAARITSLSRLGDSVETEVVLENSDLTLVAVSDAANLTWARVGASVLVSARSTDLAVVGGDVRDSLAP